MAIPVNVNNLLNSKTVESSRIEFKADFNPEPIIHTICAFANDIDNIGGGYIIVGIEEKDGIPLLPPIGIDADRIDHILKKLLEYCHNLEPIYEPIVEPIIYMEKYIIVIHVPAGFGRPYKAPKNFYIDKDLNEKSDNRIKNYYIRKFSSTVIATNQEERELFYVSSNIPFDDRPNLLSSIDDLDLELMREHLRIIGSDLYEQSKSMTKLEIAECMQLMAGSPEYRYPRNVAILMFSENPEKYFRYARIEIVDIPDPTGNGMTERIFTGPIQKQLKDSLSYIKNYILKEIIFKLPNEAISERIFNYPFKAVEEILSNAVYHRSYQINEPITVRVTPEGMEIISFPGFDRSISDENIKELKIRSHIYRNRRIGDFLKELHLIEGRNTGYPTIKKSIENNGSDYPIITMNPERDYLSVFLPIHKVFLKTDKIKEKRKVFEKEIIDILKKEPLQISELSTKLGYKAISKKLTNTINEMVINKKLIRIADGSKTKLKVSLAD